MAADRLVWLPELGMGYRAAFDPDIYDKAYFDEYLRRDDSPIGKKLTEGRINFVRSVIGRWSRDDIVDVGIGGGRFCREADTLGYDVNPEAIAWLRDCERWFEVDRAPIETVTMWDVLEHIRDPVPILRNVRRYVFVSTPIYSNGEAVVRSRHYKPNEHLHYWTRDGLLHYMRWYGFHPVSHSTFETAAGRDSIESFAFRRD